MYGPGYVACSRPESNIGGFISRPPSAASLAPDRHRAPESCVRRPDLLSVSWPKRPPEFGEWPGLRGPQPARVEYRRFYLPPAISSFSGTVRCAIGLGTGILCTPTAICRAFPGRSNHRNLVSGPVYVARSRPESNIGGFISHPPSAPFAFHSPLNVRASNAKDCTLLGGYTRTRRWAFAEGVVDDDIISDQDIQSFLSTRCRNLHRHDIALRMS